MVWPIAQLCTTSDEVKLHCTGCKTGDRLLLPSLAITWSISLKALAASTAPLDNVTVFDRTFTVLHVKLNTPTHPVTRLVGLGSVIAWTAAKGDIYPGNETPAMIRAKDVWQVLQATYLLT